MSVNGDGPSYMTQADNAKLRREAQKALVKCKEIEAERDFLPVWVDERTTKLVSKAKILRKGMEIIKVKIGGGRLAYMERKTAIKYGYING